MDSVRQEISQRYNFDLPTMDVYRTEDTAIMGMGLPPEKLLRECCYIFQQATAKRMRREVPMNHLFDGGALNVYDQQVANLSAGAPGPDLLGKSAQFFQQATEERISIASVRT
uniref:Uncharacterized protein n=1 Tax=Anopheles merus TaxID=30066 RepID=A0A182V3Q6_ANOME